MTIDSEDQVTAPENPESPRWNNTTKLVAALTVVALVGALVLRFRYIIAPLLTALLLAYFLHPLASYLHKRFKIPWRLIATLIYLLLLFSILGLLTWGGISIVEQVQNLIKFIQGLVTDLPGFFKELSSKPLMIGPFPINLANLDLDILWTQLQGMIQPLLTNLGSLIGSLASGIGTTVTWLLFIILISYFIMSESKGASQSLIKLRIPNYQEDLSKMGTQLSHIWNAFLRGQLLIFFITVAYYSLIMSVLGIRYFFLLALIAGLARFVPYIGPFVAWTTYGLVALFQTNYFNMAPFPYALLIVGVALLSDVIMDYFVSPRVMSDALAIHPAAVLVMVIISASLFGLLGVLLSAPVLASFKLLFTYIVRKLTDQDPWVGLKTISPPEPLSVKYNRIKKFFKSLWKKVSGFFSRIRALSKKNN